MRTSVLVGFKKSFFVNITEKMTKQTNLCCGRCNGSFKWPLKIINTSQWYEKHIRNRPFQGYRRKTTGASAECRVNVWKKLGDCLMIWGRLTFCNFCELQSKDTSLLIKFKKWSLMKKAAKIRFLTSHRAWTLHI